MKRLRKFRVWLAKADRKNREIERLRKENKLLRLPDPQMAVLQAERDEARKELAEARRVIAEYDNTITWETTCKNCANLLDKSIEDYETIEKLTKSLTDYEVEAAEANLRASLLESQLTQMTERFKKKMNDLAEVRKKQLEANETLKQKLKEQNDG